MRSDTTEVKAFGADTEFWTIVSNGQEVVTVGSLQSLAGWIGQFGWSGIEVQPSLPAEYLELVQAMSGQV